MNEKPPSPEPAGQKSKSKLVKWLNNLQQESWQLELVVSGFAIFLVLGALEKLFDYQPTMNLAATGLKDQGIVLTISYAVLLICTLFILVNLIFHVLLRGMWISTIGLRYVSGDIDFDSLKFSPKFDSFLRRRIGSFDSYILKLEKVCSVVFSFTFLIVFILIGFALYVMFLLGVIHLFRYMFEGVFSLKLLGLVAFGLLIVIGLTGLLYFIDFLTLGYIKRIKWLSRVYYPIYRLYSFITLATLYRPIYYNLIDNKFGRRVGFLLVPYIVLVVLILSGEVNSYAWYPEKPGSAALSNNHYDDLRGKNKLILLGSVPSKYVRNGYLEVFIRYLPFKDDKAIKVLHPDAEPPVDIGFGSDISFGGSDLNQGEADTALLFLSELIEVRIDDSLFQDPEFLLYEHPNQKEPGLLGTLDVELLSRGRHTLTVNKLEKSRDTVVFKEFVEILFWKE